MDPLEQMFIEKYGVSPEVAKELAAKTKVSRGVTDSVRRVVGHDGWYAFTGGVMRGEEAQHQAELAKSRAEIERINRSADDSLRRTRVIKFNRIEKQIALGLKVDPEDAAWYRSVKERAGKTYAAPSGVIGLDQPGFQQEYQKAAHKLVTIPDSNPYGAPLQPSAPDPTRYALMRPVEAFSEAFYDNNTAPTIDPVSGSPIGSADYHAFYERSRKK